MVDNTKLQQLISGVLHEASVDTIKDYASEIANSPGLAGVLGAGAGAVGGAMLGGEHKLRNAAIGATTLGGAAAVAASPDARSALSKGLTTLAQLVRSVDKGTVVDGMSVEPQPPGIPGGLVQPGSRINNVNRTPEDVVPSPAVSEDFINDPNSKTN